MLEPDEQTRIEIDYHYNVGDAEGFWLVTWGKSQWRLNSEGSISLFTVEEKDDA